MTAIVEIVGEWNRYIGGIACSRYISSCILCHRPPSPGSSPPLYPPSSSSSECARVDSPRCSGIHIHSGAEPFLLVVVTLPHIPHFVNSCLHSPLVHLYEAARIPSHRTAAALSTHFFFSLSFFPTSVPSTVYPANGIFSKTKGIMPASNRGLPSFNFTAGRH